MRIGDVTISTKTLVILIVVVVVAIFSFIFLGGYLEGTGVITTTQEASDAITNVSSDIEGLSRALEDIDRSLG